MKTGLFLIAVFCALTANAQDYLISFAGTGESNTVSTVKVENLTQGTNLTMSGGDVLHLMNVITGIEPNVMDSKNKISFSPNPMAEYSRIQFDLPEGGETIISLSDMSGRKIAEKKDLLSKGQHTYRLQGISNGIYFVTINSNKYSISGRLICSNSTNSDVKIVYETTTLAQEKKNLSKGTNAETMMQYNSGDMLKLTGISGNCSTIVTDVPMTSKTVTFTFITCTDGEGNYYPIVQIGTGKGITDNIDPTGDKGVQIWMAENLKATKYNDGTVIPNITDKTEWALLTSPAYCWYNNDIGNKNIYGALYNWYTVGTGKLCPSGWHVPSDAEWTLMTTALGGTSVAGGKLKETGNVHWKSPNTGATNESGFTALPGGDRDGGDFIHAGENGYWWTATKSDIHSPYSLARMMSYVSSSVSSPYGLNEGKSVRCIKDQAN